MKKLVRAVLAVGVLSGSLLLSGCENFDPTALFDSDIFSTKKKLPGERRPVFPEGTPGVPQGVPPELVKGYQPGVTPETPSKEAAAPKDASGRKDTSAGKDASAGKEATAEPAQSNTKPKAKPKSKSVVAKPAEPPPDESQPSQPSGAVTVHPTAQGPQWPDPPAAQQQQSQEQQGPVAGRWPAAPAPGGGVAWPDPPAAR